MLREQHRRLVQGHARHSERDTRRHQRKEARFAAKSRWRVAVLGEFEDGVAGLDRIAVPAACVQHKRLIGQIGTYRTNGGAVRREVDRLTHGARCAIHGNCVANLPPDTSIIVPVM